MVGAYKPCAEFIKLARRLKLDAVFVNMSFVGANALAKELGEDGKGVVVTQVVAVPGEHGRPCVARYQKALKVGERFLSSGKHAKSTLSSASATIQLIGNDVSLYVWRTQNLVGNSQRINC